MRLPFAKTYPLTQAFGVNPETYKQFYSCNKPLQGHNGTDWGCPNGTEILSPHAGKVVEVANDPPGFGYYVKIENSKEGSILAHNQKILVTVGQTVSEGQPVSLSDNTGFSTGAHLHWGYYRMPRDYCNGYSGCVDPFPYLTGGDAMADTIQVAKGTFEKLVQKSSQWDKTIAAYLPGSNPDTTPYEDLQRVIAGIKSDKTACDNKLTEALSKVASLETQITNKEEEISRVRAEVLKDEKLVAEAQKKLAELPGLYAGRIKQLEGEKDVMGKQIGNLKIQLAECQAGKCPKPWYCALLEKIFNRG